MRRTTWFGLIFLLTACTGQVAAADAFFLPPGHPDLTKGLAPPPAPTSAEQARDLAAVLAMQKRRTSAQAERALADDTAGALGFADVLGSNFTAERLPRLAALIERIRGDAVVV